MKKRVILIGSKIGQDAIQQSLGKPEYSYYFLLKEFLPVLHHLAQVVEVKSVDEVDALYSAFCSSGHEVVFLSVSPPQQTPLNLQCPTVCLFAWEFDSLPDQEWGGDKRNNWRFVFSSIAGAIATSEEAVLLVKNLMGPDYPIISAPAAIWDRYSPLFEAKQRARDGRVFKFDGQVFDSQKLGLSVDGLVPKAFTASVASTDGAADDSEEVVAASAKAKTALQWFEEKKVGSILLLKQWAHEAITPFKTKKPAELLLSGVIYTTVLNPADGRKNWIDIITAFCWAFKAEPRAVLIVKMTHHDVENYRVVLLTLLSRLSPFACRVVVLQGYLDESQYNNLIKVSDFYVNASSCEGLCLPLMEYLSAGKPAIAPFHTAMKDYLSTEIAFPVASALELTCWPHDPTGKLTTHRHRLNWASLESALRESFYLAMNQPARYVEMSAKATERMLEYSSIQEVASSLNVLFENIQKTRDASMFASRTERA